MKHVLALTLFLLCFAGMAIGLLLAKKVLRKACGDDPESCACRREGKEPCE